MVRKNQFIHPHPNKKEPIYLEPIHYAQKGWFCETCNQRKPRNNKPKVKGWKCCDCEKETK